MDRGFSEKQKHSYIFLLYAAVCFVALLFIFELVKKSIFGYLYYQRLAEGNRTREKLIIAPRGVFYDRDGVLLVGNEKDKKHGYRRRYFFPKETAHVLGYLGLPNKESLNDYSCGSPPVSYQYLGQVGLERYFECILRGLPGKVFYETDASGSIIAELARNEPTQGVNIQLALSSKLQKAAHKAFKGAKGAAIASDPYTGEVLLFYSSPSFDPAVLTGGSPAAYQEVALDEKQPLFNRLTLGIYPPGSVIKPLIATAALEEESINAGTEYEDTGVYELGGVKFGNWYYLQYGKKEGMVDVVKAISRSNDIFFYHVGVDLGIEKLALWLRKLGMDARFMQPYFPQKKSLIPSPTWKKSTLLENWYLGDTVNMSIGQGYTLVNPADMQTGLATIASGGKKCRFIFEKGKTPQCTQVKIQQSTFELVKRGMVAACSTGGTGWPFFDFKVNGKLYPVACKTGTAESQQKSRDPHAWFTAFAPVDRPTIALTVLVENGGEGSSVAAPIAKEILEQYFR